MLSLKHGIIASSLNVINQLVRRMVGIVSLIILARGLTLEDIGIAFGPAFYGFTLAMIIGGFMVDLFGMKKIMNIAFITHLGGIVLTLFARDFTLLFLGTLLIGI